MVFAGFASFITCRSEFVCSQAWCFDIQAYASAGFSVFALVRQVLRLCRPEGLLLQLAVFGAEGRLVFVDISLQFACSYSLWFFLFCELLSPL